MRKHYSSVVATLALILSLGGTAYAVTALEPNSVGTVQLKAGAVRSTDLAANAVRTTDIRKDAVRSSDVATNGIQSADVNLPDPTLTTEADGAGSFAPADGTYVKLDDVGTFDKVDPTSAIEVDWSGVVASRFSPSSGTSIPCGLQLRVDGAVELRGAGELYVGSGDTTSAATSAIFEGLPVGTHTVELWARSLGMGGAPAPANCVVGPDDADVSQTATVTELAI